MSSPSSKKRNAHDLGGGFGDGGREWVHATESSSPTPFDLFRMFLLIIFTDFDLRFLQER